MKDSVPVIFVVALALLLYNKFPKEITVILWLVLIALVINKWGTLKKNFS